MGAIGPIISAIAGFVGKKATAVSQADGWSRLYLIVIITIPIVFYDLAIVWDVIATDVTFDEGAELMQNHMTTLLDEKSKYGHVLVTMVAGVFSASLIKRFFGKK